VSYRGAVTEAPVTAPPLPAVPPPAARRRGAPLLALLVAAASAVGVGVLHRVFVATTSGQWVEYAAYQGARYGQSRLWQVAERVLDVVSVGFILVVLLTAMAIAVLRRRWLLAVQVAVLMAGANLTTQLLKGYVLDRADLGVPAGYGNTLPSGHTTAAGSVAAALLLVVPPRVRPWVAVLGAGYTAVTGVSTLVGQWHRPSDVVAAVLVVLAWTAVACVLAGAARPRSGTATGAIPVVGGPRGRGETAARLVETLLGVLGAGASAVAGVLLAQVWSQAGDQGLRVGQSEHLVAYAGGAAGVVGASCLAFAVMLGLRRASAGRATARATRA